MDLDTVARAKEFMASNSESEAGRYWLERLSPWLGDSFLEQGDSVLADTLASWTTEEEGQSFGDAVGQAEADSGAAMMAWLDDLLDRLRATSDRDEVECGIPNDQALGGAGQAAAAEAVPDYFLDIAEAGEGWWVGFDPQTGSTWYVQSAQRPDGATPGWILAEDDRQVAAAEELLASEPAPGGGRHINFSAVAEYQGWWVAWDTAAGDWCYIESADPPDDAMLGWMPQDEAFTLMASRYQAAEVSQEARPAAQPDVVQELTEMPELASLFQEFDPNELFADLDLTGYTVDQIKQALLEADRSVPGSAVVSEEPGAPA